MFFKEAVVLLWCYTYVRGNFDGESAIAYDAEGLLSQIFTGNISQSRTVIKFADQSESSYVRPDVNDSELPNTGQFKFQKDQEAARLRTNSYDENGSTNVRFENLSHEIVENGINNTLDNVLTGNRKKKRRRRKLRKQLPGQLSAWNPAYLGPNGPVSRPGHGFGSLPGHSFNSVPGAVHNLVPPSGPSPSFEMGPGHRPGFEPTSGPTPGHEPNRFQPDFKRPFYRVPRRPQPSLASEALAAVTGALTSVAHNDDHQCVARLLCEAAAGGALGGSSLLDSVTGLQPLLTLLSAYNGISSNPLFVFGRAAFLGMSSKGQPGSCRYAYPLCPTDPEELVHYLNNHNGGFFRFFNSPQQGQQNIEQFYKQLSQNYGLYQSGPINNQEFYGLLNSDHYQGSVAQSNLYPNVNSNLQNYGFAYPYNQNYNNYNNGNRIRFKSFNSDKSKVEIAVGENKIEKRIQNKPVSFINDNSAINPSKWLFPEDDDYREDESFVQYVDTGMFDLADNGKSKTFKFPDAGSIYNNDIVFDNKYNNPYHMPHLIRKQKGIFFPERQNDQTDYQKNKYSNNIGYYKYDERVKDIYKNGPNSSNDYQEEPGVTTVYVVRGNGDPNKPEIIKLRPGESLMA